MNNIIFGVNINAELEDNTEVTGVTGHLIDNKRVYKLADNTILTGTKKIKKIKSVTFTVPAEILHFIMTRVNN